MMEPKPDEQTMSLVITRYADEHGAGYRVYLRCADPGDI